VNAVVNDPNGVAEVGKYSSVVEVMLAMACVLPWSDVDEVSVFGEARPVVVHAAHLTWEHVLCKLMPRANMYVVAFFIGAAESVAVAGLGGLTPSCRVRLPS
jgi:hypothetical protein